MRVTPVCILHSPCCKSHSTGSAHCHHQVPLFSVSVGGTSLYLLPRPSHGPTHAVLIFVTDLCVYPALLVETLVISHLETAFSHLLNRLSSHLSLPSNPAFTLCPEQHTQNTRRSILHSLPQVQGQPAFPIIESLVTRCALIIQGMIALK